VPELVARLILAEHGTRAALRFPSGDSVQLGGWDGASEVSESSPFVPSGTARWEFGAQKQGITGKADEDYTKRTADPLRVIREDAAYVHVTPRRWVGKSKWIAARAAEKKWRSVQALDADDLVHWIERHPVVGHWLAVVVGKRPAGLRQLEEVWNEWALATAPPLTSDLILVNRDEESARLLRWLREPAAVLTVQAETSEEAMAFLHATVSQLPPPYRESRLARCLVSGTSDTHRTLKQSLTALTIATPEHDPGPCQDLAKRGHHVFVALGAEAGTDVGDVILSRPHREEIRQELVSMGFGDSEAGRLAEDAGRSLAVLRRLIPSAPGRIPTWAKSPSNILAGAMLAGSWSDSHAGDREFLETLAGEPYDKVAELLTRLAATLDAPVRKAGDAWKVTSPRDFWFLLASYLSEELADRFFDHARTVLSERDPLFSLTGEQRWMAPVRGIKEPHSPLLRQGLAKTLILFALYGTRSKAVSSPSTRVTMLVDSLLDNADEARWWSLRNEFVRLAEAAPDAFLGALETTLDVTPSPLLVLFGEDKDAVFGREHVSGLLWALEQLAWSPAHFARVAQILCALDAIDPGGKFTNRPANSLRDVFLLWSPQTTLPLADRLKVLDMLRRRFPDGAWKLMLRLVPNEHETSMPNARPLWRDFGIDDAESVTYPAITQGVREIAARLLSDARHDPVRWSQLIGKLSNFPMDLRQAISQKLEEIIGSIDESLFEPLRDTLRKVLGHHRQFAHADWAMNAAELDVLERIYGRIQSTDLATQYAWLFSNHPTLPNLADASWDVREKALAELRQKAARAFLELKDPNALYSFAEGVAQPGFVGAAAIETGWTPEALAEIAKTAVQSEHGSVQVLAHGMLVRGHELLGATWSAEILRNARDWPAAVVARVLRAMPVERQTWDLAASFGNECEQEYWKRAPLFALSRDTAADNVEFAIRKLLKLGHGRTVIFFAGQHLKIGIGADLLDQALVATAKDESPIDPGNEAVMFAHYVGEILDALEANGSLPHKRLVELEWMYFPVLRNAQRRTGQLYAALSSDPEFFFELLKLVYRASPESGIVEPESADVERAKSMASQAWRVLHDWRRVPGSNEHGEIDSAALESWVKRARVLCAGTGRAEIGDQCIGNIMAAAPVRDEEVWPPVPVREVIELVRSKHLQIGFVLGVKNRRGVTSRGMLDGGMQERDLAARYRRWAAETQLEWPRTSSALEEIAQSYESDGRRFDIQAERTEW